MLKKIIPLSLVILSLTACTLINKEPKKIYLDDKYYGSSDFVNVTEDDIPKKENFVLYTYNNYCNFSIPCDTIFKSFMESHNIAFVSIPFAKFKNTKYYQTVKYAPSVIIIKKGKVIAYLDAESNEDLIKYQDVDDFETWIEKYIYFEK